METLSDQIITTPGSGDEGRLQVEAVKSFIEQLKEILDNDVDEREQYISKQIDKLAGEKLL